jgi:hypothetical protein
VSARASRGRYIGAAGEEKGPRYCPSFEAKIVRFEHRDRHQVRLKSPTCRCSVSNSYTSVYASLYLLYFSRILVRAVCVCVCVGGRGGVTRLLVASTDARSSLHDQRTASDCTLLLYPPPPPPSLLPLALQLDLHYLQVWLEPEGLESDVIYPAGISNTLPEEIQLQLVRSIKGCENATMLCVQQHSLRCLFVCLFVWKTVCVRGGGGGGYQQTWLQVYFSRPLSTLITVWLVVICTRCGFIRLTH